MNTKSLKPSADTISQKEAICDETFMEKVDWIDYLESEIRGCQITEIRASDRKAEGISVDESNKDDSVVVIMISNGDTKKKIILLGHSDYDFDNDLKVGVLGSTLASEVVESVSLGEICTYWLGDNCGSGGEYYTIEIRFINSTTPVVIEGLTYSDSWGDVGVPEVVIRDVR
jgi:hypothetical protein